MVMLAGEITSNAEVDFDAIARKTINDIGYNNSECGFEGDTCAVITALGKQSGDIAMGVDESDDHEQGAGDQGLMFGLCHQRNGRVDAGAHHLLASTGSQTI